MYLKMMLFTCSIVILYAGIRYIFSFFRVAKKLSILALSKQCPAPLKLCTSPASLKVFLNASLVYWLPRSL